MSPSTRRNPPFIEATLKPVDVMLTRINSHAVPYGTCVALYILVATCVALIPFKEFYLGSYVTKPFDEVRYDSVARQLNQLGVVTSGVHYYDTFRRSNLPFIDSGTKSAFKRTDATTLSFSSFIVRANLRRSDLLKNLPADILSLPVNTMVDIHAPLCGPDSSFWKSKPQQLFGTWFPTISHEFCRDFHDEFPHDRFFNYNTKAPIDQNLAHVGSVTLGLIAVVNMSEVYLRQFTDPYVIRKIMKNVQEGFLGMELPNYSDAAAEAIVDRYRTGIPLADVIKLLPGSIDNDHVALVDVLSISALLDFYLTSQQLNMGMNIVGEAAIMAEVTHATASYVTSDFIINTVGMHDVSTVYLAPFWACAIKHTTMKKNITVADVDATAIKQCGDDLATTLPVFIVNLMYLFQSKERDYSKIDNTTSYTLGRRRESDADYVPLVVPETFEGSALLSMDGTAWTKVHQDTPQSLAETPYGYLYTPDCRNLVDNAMQQSGRNVQKYQAYLGDGLGNCAFRDSQETTPQTLCRLFMTADDLLFRSLDGTLVTLPTCSSLLSEGANAATLALEQENLRQVEWFMVETTMLSRRVRIQDNTSRQIRTFLLVLNLLGATLYSISYLITLSSVVTFISNSVYRPAAAQNPTSEESASRYSTEGPARIGILDLMQCDPADGALLHSGVMALLYLGAVGALSNIFSLGCSAELSSTEGSVVIHCVPSIPLSSRGLVFTTLSSSYWIIRISLQTRTLVLRLAQASRPDLLRFWVLNFITVLIIHYICKGCVDLVFHNVELESDPHLFAMLCSFILTLVISVGSLVIQSAAGSLAHSSRRRRKGCFKQLTKSAAWRLAISKAASERRFAARWSSSELDSVLHYCATPQIARQLQLSRRRRIWGQSQSNLILDPNVDTRDVVFHIQEFVIVHCAAGVHSHLKYVRWGADGNVIAVNHSKKAKLLDEDENTDRRRSVQVKQREPQQPLTDNETLT
ncbi:hypothetical protein PHYBOEH_003276 [Phytophthora boehmeriae]|uniref:Transmembrane protein n=1 Tax=Phytophthora boehmeriae TaxID=109152 RepID=A0A8T1WQL9_9STRA|nr:hypothetical protein PHYBOEH_003276 [Phytophthora boehmeriae]